MKGCCGVYLNTVRPNDRRHPSQRIPRQRLRHNAVDAPLLAVANVVVAALLIGLVMVLVRLNLGSGADSPKDRTEDRGY